MRAVPLLVESCEVGDGPINGLVWFATTALPASSALPSRPPGSPGRRKVHAEEWPRPLPVSAPTRPRRASGHGAGARPRSRRTRRVNADSEGSPGCQCRPPGGPNQGRVGGARKAESEAARGPPTSTRRFTARVSAHPAKGRYRMAVRLAGLLGR